MKKMICVMLLLALTLCGCSLGQGEETSQPTESSTVQTTAPEAQPVDETAETTQPEESAQPEETTQPDETTESTVSPSEGSNLLTTETAPGKIEGEPPEGDYQIPPQPTTEVSDS